MEKTKKTVLIVGAGEAGRMVLNEIKKHNKKLNYKIEGFVDDDPAKIGKTISRYKVLGPVKNITDIVKKKSIDLILIAIPSADGRTIRKIIKNCKKTKSEFYIVPGIYKIISGDVKMEQVRKVKPEDLLGRETVKINRRNLTNFFKDKSVMVTGGAGSIGSEICSQLCRFKLKQLILVDQNESELFYIKNVLRKTRSKTDLHFHIADICNKYRMFKIMNKQRPDLVFHAAAYKHVPLMESNIYEAVRVNIYGSSVLLELAEKFKVDKFLFISTDKAVNPCNIMGASKRFTEKLIQMYSKRKSKVKYLSVRFGNVLGSRGSVVPLFMNQIAEGGPVTITHPDIYRFFMSINEAVTLVLQSIFIGSGGEIFVLDMGEQVKISDLARDLITLAGFVPGKDIKVKCTGLRPGEKLYEELLTSEDKVNTTEYNKIFIAKPEKLDTGKVKTSLNNIKKLLSDYNFNDNKFIKNIKQVVPEYKKLREPF